MTMRAYLTPAISQVQGGETAFFCKYQNTDLAGLSGPLLTEIAENELICIAAFDFDANPSQDALLTAEADVTALPVNVNSQVGLQLGNVQAKLDAWHIPSGWVTSSTTYLTILRAIWTYFDFMQAMRAAGYIGTLFPTGVTLNTTFGSLSATIQSQMLAAAQAKHYDTTGLTANTTLRTIMKSMMDQNKATQVFMGNGLVF